MLGKFQISLVRVWNLDPYMFYIVLLWTTVSLIRKGEKGVSSLWKMVRHAHHPEPVEGGRQGGIFKALKYYKNCIISNRLLQLL